MQVSAINNNHSKPVVPSFGHSFRVSICLKDELTGLDMFVNPYTEKKLYQTLNSKIVSLLNLNYYASIRKALGLERKVGKTEPLSEIHKQLIDELKFLDTDYNLLSMARSVYNGGKLGYIVTGVDVPIVENAKGIRNIGTARADSMWYNGTPHSAYVKSLAKLVQENVLDYVKNSSVLLRSKDNKEIMLKATFKQSGKTKSGVPNYELDKFEFHENRSNPTLSPVLQSFSEYKTSSTAKNFIRKTVQSHAEKTAKRKVYNTDVERIIANA